MEPKKDLRVTRTKKMIAEAFINLLFEKRFSQITIQEIADKAMINRNTFYLHYKDKTDLLEKISDACIDELKDSIHDLRKKEDVYHPNYQLETDAVFSHIEQNLRIYQAFLLKGDFPYFNTLLKTFLFDSISQEIRRQRVFDYKNFLNLRIYIEYCASGYFGVITFWLENYTQIPLADVKKGINQIISNYVLI